MSQRLPLPHLALGCLAAVSLLMASIPLALAERSAAQLKAGFLYNFVKHTDWPAPGRQRVLCVAPRSLPIEALSGIDGLPLREATLVARQVDTPSDTEACDVLFLGRAQREAMDAWLDRVSNQAVLTISDLSAVERSGAMIQMFTEGRRIRYALDLVPARHAGLTLNPRLLNLADTIYSE